MSSSNGHVNPKLGPILTNLTPGDTVLVTYFDHHGHLVERRRLIYAARRESEAARAYIPSDGPVAMLDWSDPDPKRGNCSTPIRSIVRIEPER